MPPTGDYPGNRSKGLRPENGVIMGSVGPDTGEDLPRCSKSTLTRKCRLPKKYLDEWSTVAPVSVPRKLRSSAMKKRMNDGGVHRLPGSDGPMKSKLKRVELEGCVARAVREGVSMDEVEVAEALFALSGGLGGKSSALTKDDIYVPSIDAVSRREDDHKTDNHHSDSVLETAKPPSEKFACSKPEVNLHLTAFISENQPAICDSGSGAWTQIRKTRSKPGTLEKGQAYNYQDTALTQNADANTKAENNGSSSKRNLSSAIPVKSPIGITSGTATPTVEPDGRAKKGAPFSTCTKNSWRRSCTHAYVCRYIKAFQEKDASNKKLLQSSYVNGVPCQRDQHRTDTNQSGARTSLISFSSPAKNATTVESAILSHTSPAKNATEVENAMLLHKMLVKDQQQASQQSLGPLSRHAGVGHAKQKAGNSSQTENQAYTSFPGNHNLYSSTSSSGHCPIAPGLQVQLPPYFSSRSYVPFTDVNTLTVQQFEQQNGNRLVPMLVTNFDPSLVVPGKQTGPFFHPGQASFHHSHPSPEVHGYTPILQQQQQQQQHASRNAKGPYHHLPSGYDSNVGRVRPDKLVLHHCR